jgi:hypothetical protein
LLLNCEQHGLGVVGWVSCSHVDRIRLARRHETPVEGVAGEALCGVCRALLDARDRRVLEHVAFRCEPCVVDRWPVEGAN